MDADHEIRRGTLFRSFVSPPRCRVSARELAVLDEMESFELAPPDPSIDPRCVAIHGYSQGSGPRVLLVHGWGGRAAQFASFVNPLIDAGFRVLAVDTAAHGDSEGERTSVFEFVDTLAKVQEHFRDLHGVIGHSLGGASILMALASKALRASRALLIAPTPRLIDETAKFAERRELVPAELEELQRELELHFGEDIWSRTDLQTVARNVVTRTLVVHDELDPDVPFKEAQPLAESLNDAELHSTRGLGHVSLLRAPVIAELAARFMA